MRKGNLYYKTLEKHGEIRKVKIHMGTILLLMFTGLLFTTEDIKKRLEYKYLNEMKC